MGKNLILWMLFSFCMFCNAQTPYKDKEDKQREYDKAHPTSLSNIKRNVGYEFEKWAQKGVLEKTTEWNDRILRYGPQIFDSLCYETITKLVWLNLLMQENGYDADSEKLKSNFYYIFASKMIAGYVDFPRDKYKIVLNNYLKPQVVKIINVAVIDNCVWPQKETITYDRIGEMDRIYPINPTNLEIQFKDLIVTNSGLKTMLGECTFKWNSIIAEQRSGMYGDYLIAKSSAEAQARAEARRNAEDARRLAEMEAQRKAAAARARAEAEASARANANSGRVQGAFGRGTHPENSGSTQGQGVQGSPIGNSNVGRTSGTGSTGNAMAKVSSRTVKMLQKPTYSDRTSEGTIVVAITIDSQGRVATARIINATTTSSKLRDSALAAARNSTFSAGESNEAGTITYVFKQR